MTRFIGEFDAGKLDYLKTCGWVMFTASALLTFYGFVLLADANGADAMGYFIATIIAGGAAAFFHAFWHTAIGTVAAECRTLQRTIGLMVIGVGMIFIVAISSWSNVTALAGNAAMNKHLEITIALASTTLTEHYQQGTVIKNVLPDIRREIIAYQNAADNEFKHGAITSTPGTGAVQLFLQSKSDNLATLEEQITAHITHTEARIVDARKLLDKARTIAAKDTHIAERLNKVSRVFDRLTILLSDMDASGLAGSVKRMLDTLPASANTLRRFSKNPQTAARQKTAIEGIEKSLTITAGILGEVADSIANLPPLPETAVTRLSPMQAVLTYAHAFVPAWIAGIAIDCGYLLVLLMIMISKSGLSPEERSRLRVESKTIGDVLDIQRANERTRRQHHPEKTIQDDNNAHFGVKDEDEDKDEEGDDQ